MQLSINLMHSNHKINPNKKDLKHLSMCNQIITKETLHDFIKKAQQKKHSEDEKTNSVY